MVQDKKPRSIMKPVKVEIAEKFKVKDTYTEKLNLAIAMGFKTLSEAFGHYGREQFEKHFAESLNPKKHK